MTNYSPNRTGLIQYYTRRRIKADTGVHRAIAKLSRRTDIPPSKAMRMLLESLRPHGVSKRTLQRYWQAEIGALRRILRNRYRPEKARRRDKMLAALGQTPAPPTSPKWK